MLGLVGIPIELGSRSFSLDRGDDELWVSGDISDVMLFQNESVAQVGSIIA